MSLPSSGTATFMTTVKVRTAPSTASEQVAKYSRGETVRYDQLVHGDGRTWISYVGGSGIRRYCCAVDADGTALVSAGGAAQSTGGGLPYLQKQSRHEGVRKSGCLFCCCCWLANLNTIDEVDNAFEWCVGRGYVRRSDAYCQGPTRLALARTIAEHYGKSVKSGLDIAAGPHHFWVVDNSGREVYNSAGWGWGH